MPHTDELELSLRAKSNRVPHLNRAAQALFFVNAAIWFLFGIISLARLASKPGQEMAAMVIGLLMLGNVGAMLAAGIGMGRQNRWLYYFGVAVLLVNIILTFTDEFGIFDLITLLLDVLLLGLLVVIGSRFRLAR